MEKAPREFKLTVHFDGLIPRIFFNNFVQMSTFKSEEQLHVIEYTAYQNLQSKLKIAVEALKFYASDSSWNSVGAYFYNRIDSIDESTVDGLDKNTYFGGKNARKAIKEIEGSIEKE